MSEFNAFQFNPEELTILKNFAAVNQNMIVRGGKTIRTIDIPGQFLAEMNLERDWPEFIIYDMSELLSVMSMFNSPSMDFREDCVVINEGGLTAKFRFADESVIMRKAPDVEGIFNFEQDDISINLTQEQLGTILKMSSIMKLNRIGIVAQDGEVSIRVFKPTMNEIDLSNDFNFKLEPDQVNACLVDGMAVIILDSLKLLPAAYRIDVHAKGRKGGAGNVTFTANGDKHKGLRYMTPLEKSSKLEVK